MRCASKRTCSRLVDAHVMKRPLTVLLGSLLMASVAFAFEMYNDKCPVDGKLARPIYRMNTAKGWVAFCCGDCQETYKRSPNSYQILPKEKK